MKNKIISLLLKALILSLFSFHSHSSAQNWKPAQEGNKIILIRHSLAPGGGDPVGFKINDKFLTSDDYKELLSLHDWKKWEHNSELTWGEWCKPVWPKTRSLMGSVPTPYIFDDRCDWQDAGAVSYTHLTLPTNREV